MLHLKSLSPWVVQTVHVRSSFSTKEGTIITDEPGAPVPNAQARAEHNEQPTDQPTDQPTEQRGGTVEAPIISGVAHDRSQAKVTVVGVPDQPGYAAKIFQIVADAEANVDMIVQNVSSVETGKTDISFTLPRADVDRTVQALDKAKGELGYSQLKFDDHIGKLSLVGAGMRTNPGVSAKLFKALSDANINIEMISTSEIRISVVTSDEELDDAVRAVHTAFELDSAEGEAVVYGGTGR